MKEPSPRKASGSPTLKMKNFDRDQETFFNHPHEEEKREEEVMEESKELEQESPQSHDTE